MRDAEEPHQGLSVARAAAEVLRLEEAKDDLLLFIELTHPRWETSWHHVILCDHLMRLERQDECAFCGQPFERLAVFAPPRHGKTEVVSRRFPAWCLGRHPEWQMICAQATGQLALDTGANVRDIVRSPEFKRIFPEVRLQEDAQAAGRWLTDSGGIYYAAGCDGTIVGRGANLLDIDDPHGGRLDADSQRMRDIRGQWYFGDAVHRLMSPAIQLLTLTRWHEDDLAGRILPPDTEWKPTDNPRLFCADDWHVLRFRAIELEGTDNEAALWSGVEDQRYPLERLRRTRALLHSKGRAREWRSQYQQEPVSEEGTYIRREWFEERYDPGWTRSQEHPHGLPQPLRIYMASDFAVSAPREGALDPDFTEHGVFGMGPDDRVYVIDWWYGQTTSDVWIDELIALFQQHRPQAWFGEAGPIRRAIEAILERRMLEQRTFVRCEWIPSTRDKGARGRAFQAWSSSRRIIFPMGLYWADRIVDQCAAFPSGRHDDAFDVCSLMMQVVDQMHPAISLPEPIEERRRDRYEKVIQFPTDRWKTA